MRYYGSITIPANTLYSALVTAHIEISFGTISQFYRLFPPGCAGMVHLQVFHQTRQVFPTTPGTSYIGDGSEILGTSQVEISEPPTVLELRAWSPGSTYQHIVYVEFYIAQPYALIPVPLTQVALPEGF